MRNRILLIFLVLIVVPTAIAVAQQKRATPPDSSSTPASPNATDVLKKRGGSVSLGAPTVWLMTDEERITLRTASGQPDGRIHAASTPQPGYRESVDGSRNPELLLPHELFEHLLWGLSTNPARKEHAHVQYDAKIQNFGYDVDKFWAVLASASRPYVSALEKHPHGGATGFVSSGGQPSYVPIAQDVCAARLVALQNSRRLLGGKDFDRFLYSVVAPQLQYAQSGTAPDRAGQLRFMAGGCK